MFTTTHELESHMNGQISSLIATEQAADLQRTARKERLTRTPERTRWARLHPTRIHPDAREQWTP